MRRFTTCATALILVWLGTLVIAQTKITTLEEYAKLMKSNAQTNGAHEQGHRLGGLCGRADAAHDAASELHDASDLLD